MNKEEKGRFIEIVKELCEILDIDEPKIIFDSVEPYKASETTKAILVPSDNTIHLTSDNSLFDSIFTVSHELRHVWQDKYHHDIYLADYKIRAEFNDVWEYNRQKAEIDAIAFSVVAMEDFFGVTPIFNGMPEEIREMIEDRADYIADCE